MASPGKHAADQKTKAKTRSQQRLNMFFMRTDGAEWREPADLRQQQLQALPAQPWQAT
ncbi:MAG: hypothetical protein ACK559_03080 [bacterium]